MPPVAIVKVVNGVWQLRLRTSTRFKAGAYTLVVGAVDATGAAGATAARAFKLT